MITKNIDDLNTNIQNFEETAFFEGYASVFNVVDYVGDVVLPGAFSINGNNSTKLLWQHDHKTPIGMIDDMYEDEHGLLVKGRMFLSLHQGREAHILVKNKVTDHLSIGYDVVDSYEQDGFRYITKLNLWEISVVTFPANKYAEILNLDDMKMLDNKLNKAINTLKTI
ncbi:MAG: HK97 family phage prohead protease [Candidatus Midichloriaceae bacterium]|jgi:HK97 family phage prohead protease